MKTPFSLKLPRTLFSSLFFPLLATSLRISLPALLPILLPVFLWILLILSLPLNPTPLWASSHQPPSSSFYDPGLNQSPEAKSLVTVRSPQSPVADFYKYLSFNPSTITPMKAFDQYLTEYSLSELWFEKLSNIKNISSPLLQKKKLADLEKELLELPPCVERYQLLKSVQNDLNALSVVSQKKIPSHITDEFEKELRRLRKIPAGQDLVLYVNHQKWDEQSNPLSLALPSNHFQTWTLLSSAWRPCQTQAPLQQALLWLKNLKTCPLWVEGSSESYQWQSLGFLSSYKRDVFWNSDSITADNWFNPSLLLGKPLEEKKDSFFSSPWVWSTLAVLSGLFLYENRNKELIIQFN
jgi:hypothetical protein